MNALTLEQRVAALEAAVQDLRRKEQTTQPWLERVAGCLANEPEFAKVIEYGRYWREHGHEPAQIALLSAAAPAH